MIDINWTYLNEVINNNQTIQYINQSIVIPLIEQTNIRNTLMWFAIIGFLMTILAFFTIKKKIKQMQEDKVYIDKKAQEIFEEFKKLSNNEKLNEIDIRDLPRPVRENILQHESLLSKMFFKSNKEGYKPPFMILIRSDKTAEIKHNAKEGELILQKKDALKTKVRIILSTQKLISLKTEKGRQDFWLVYEDEGEPYPHEPKHFAKEFYQIILALQMAKTGLAKKGKFPKILIIIGAVLVIGVVVAVWWFNKGGPAPEELNTAINITQNLSQTAMENVTFKQIKV